MLEKAIQIALAAHKGQLDKAGKPYIEHSLRVMGLGSTDDEKIVGVLHDVIEDTSYTIEMLINEGFSTDIIEALKCITKTSDDEAYNLFIKRVKKNKLATTVKLNDLTDNMDIRRLQSLTKSDYSRLCKYHVAYKLLKGEPYSYVNASRIDHPNAYKPWSEEDDMKLETLWCEGKTISDLSDIFKRKKSAIESHIVKLELEEKYPDKVSKPIWRFWARKRKK